MKNLVIIGGGPAGLGAAYKLSLNIKKIKDYSLILIDKNERLGGLSRSFYYKGYFFDVGPHRFYTKNKIILNLWKQILKKDFQEISRLTRILYDNKLYNYPIEIKDVIYKLGFQKNIKCFLSFLKSKIFITKNKTDTFEGYITNHFGEELYKIFFKTYTEKVWGIPCSQISAKWASQRIKNLNFIEIIKSSLFKNNSSKAKSLVRFFYYPKNGAGSMYEKIGKIITQKGAIIFLNSKVKEIYHQKNKITKIVFETRKREKSYAVDYLFSSMPINRFVLALRPKPPKEILQAAKKIYFRDHITVNFLLEKEPFPDNWIYVHSPNLKMARITNYNSFVNKDKKSKTPISVEYFCFKKDKLWQMSDKDLIKFAKKELIQAGFAKEVDIKDGFVIREVDAYPVYYLDYQKEFNILKEYLSNFLNLTLIGRGGMYKYNNMDHSLLMGILAAENFLNSNKKYDLWQINEDDKYLES
jgi:protoporphyrinogen oxidase